MLVAGGWDENNGIDNAALSSAELYDPATGKFTPTGSMTTARYGFTAILLPDGRVLMIGGMDAHDVLASAELYEP